PAFRTILSSCTSASSWSSAPRSGSSRRRRRKRPKTTSRDASAEEMRMDARQHTDRHYELELKELNLQILQMGGLVEKQIEHAVRGLVDRDDDLCRTTIERDHTVNRMDVDIDDLCIRLL